jgi:hypothetical protein
MILNTTSKRIRVYLEGAVAANEPDWYVSWADLDDATPSFAGLATSGLTNGVTPVEVVAPPAGGIQRQVKYLEVFNSDTAQVVVWIEHYDGTQRPLFRAELEVDERVIYAHEVGWTVYGADGTVKSFSSPLTTKGDIWGYSTEDDRIPVGADDEILVADSAVALGVKWTAQIPRRPLSPVSVNFGLSPYSVLEADDVILADSSGGAVTVGLPAVALSDGRVVYVKKVDASGNAVSADGDGAELVDGLATFDLLVQYESVTLFCDGSQWWSL